MRRRTIRCALWLTLVAGCCPTITLEEWSSTASVLAGNWQWDWQALDIVTLTVNADGDPSRADLLRRLVGGQPLTTEVILDGQAHPVDDPNLSDIATYVGRARATKTGQPDVLAEGDEIIVEIEMRLLVSDPAAFGPCPEHVVTVDYTFVGTFDDQGQAAGTVVTQMTPTESAGRVSQTVADQVSDLVPIVPSLAIRDSVLMHRP